jgi:hypothetical protein
MSETHALTQRQIRCLEKLPEDHKVVSTDDPPIVSGPNGKLLRIKPNGRMVALVESAQSYLDING